MFATNNNFGFGNAGFAGVSLDSILKTNDITPKVQTHLVRVYSTLAACTAAASAGVWLDLNYHLGGITTFFGMMAAAMWINSADRRMEDQRFWGLMAFSVLNGINIGNLVDAVLYFDPSILIVATLATSTIFLCFTGGALLSPRRSYLYLGGVLGSVLSVMMWMSLANMFFRSAVMYNAQLYGGLLVFAGYVVFDTQVVIERASMGNKDHISDAMMLFGDLMSIFIRILIILLRNREQDEDKRRRRRR